MTQRLRQALLTLCVGLLLLGISASLFTQEVDTTVTVPHRLLYLARDFRFGRNRLYNECFLLPFYRGQSLGYRLFSEAPSTQSRPEWLVMQNTQVPYVQLLNPVRNSVTRHIAFDTKRGSVYQWRLPLGLVLGAGPGVLVEAATSYNGRN